MSTNSSYSVPGVDLADGHRAADTLQMRLHALNDLALTLKHAHWNVVGKSFIGVHEMLDPQIDLVRTFTDDVAERMATMGVSPNGLAGDLVARRSWDDYPASRADVPTHLRALNKVYDTVIADHRAAIAIVSEIDPVTEDLLIGQTAELEKFQWFLRAHLEDAAGNLDA